MRCLVVGGTGFLGGAIADALADANHAVTVLSRGSTVRRTRAAIDVLAGDRFGPLEVLQDRTFDWVFDTCAYTPDAVRALLDVVGDRIQRYCLISSISAYDTFTKRWLDETAPVPTASAETLEQAARVPAQQRASAVAYGAAYGPLKRACEIEAREMLGDRATALRVGLLVGAGDYSDRLTWWVRRFDGARGDIPAPAPRQRPLQLIDVRDVADFALRCGADGLSGIWNVTGQPMPFADAIGAIVDTTGSTAHPVWVSETAIAKAELTPWIDVPMMAPLHPDFRYFMEVSTEKARAAGLRCRPFVETLRPLIAWDRSRRDVALKGGMDAEQEARLLGI